MKWVKKEEDMKVPIKSWCENIQEGAIEQAINASKHPAVFHHIALLSDCHKGYGVPIGSVIACKDAVIPNAVGVDISCVDNDTEFLSPEGWNKIIDYDGGLVMQFNPSDDTGEFVEPLRYIKEPCYEFIHIKTKYGIDQMLSENHNCLVYKYDRKYNFKKYQNITAKEIEQKHNDLKEGFRHRFKTSFILKYRRGVRLTDDEIRVLVMVSADGHVYKTGDKCQVAFKKKRKIDRCEYLLQKAGITITHRHRNTNDSESITFAPPNKNKMLTQFWDSDLHQLKIITDEVLYWGDNIKDECFFTNIRDNADFIHYAFTATDKRATLRGDKRKDRKNIEYRVYLNKNNKIGINGTPKTPIHRVRSEDGFKYCFTVPSSYLVLRRNGNVFITGNCGMRTVKTTLRKESFYNPPTIKKILNIIEKTVPVGTQHHKHPPKNDFVLPGTFHHVTEREEGRLDKQLGTLGGGNHFIEIQEDTNGNIWFMIHCGSRNFGKKICDYYNGLAKKLNARWHTNVDESWDLSFLPIGSYEAKAYIEEMKVAMAFALENRRLISERVKEAFKETIDCDFDTDIDVNHNYAAMENHFGQNVWVHRKGAIRARKGEIGIIPGSMGTPSYIVEGYGNPDSFNSCSHGAGRVMGRFEASRTLAEEDCNKAMEGVIFSGWGTNRKGNVDLGEAPQAYKDIDEVMAAQEDLVISTVKLKPLGVVKAKEGRR